MTARAALLPSSAFAVSFRGDALPLGVSAATIVLVLAVASAVLLVVRLRRRARIDRTARVLAEHQAWLANNLQQLAAALSRARVPHDVIDVCIPEMLHSVSAAAGAIVLVADERGTGEIVRAVGCGDPRPAQRVTFAAYAGLLEATTVHRITPVTPRPEQSERAEVIDFLMRQAAAWAVPLVSAGRAIGLLVMGFDAARTFAPDEQEFLLTAGRRVAEAFARAELYEATERARADAEALRARADEELRERHKVEAALRDSETKYRALAARTNRLYALSAALSGSITVHAVAEAIVRRSRVVVGASAGSVSLLTEDRSHFQTLYGDPYAERPAGTSPFPAEPGLCATAAVETGEPVFIGSFAEWQQRYWRSASIAADGGFESAAVLPLIVGDTTIGIIAFHFTAPVHFDEEFTALLISVTQHSAQAIDRARLYEAAQRARSEAETANRSKDDFLSVVSHELRTPLTAVLGWAAMLRNNALDPERTGRAIDAIYTNATRQAKMIDELLDISRIVAGRAVLEIEDLDLRETLRGAVETVMPLATAKRLELHVGADPSVPVRADPRRLDQVFLNLLSNAVKFTPPGGRISVDVLVEQQTVAVRVSDTGSGIAPEFVPHVFERFRQGENSTVRSVGGLGLGLFIARELVEAQGGSIRAESGGPGSGATFIVTLPIAEGRAAGVRRAADEPLAFTPPPAPPSTALRGMRVLVVDDDAEVRDLMAEVLRAAGATVIAADSALAALAALERSEVDVLLADIAMPGQDGYDLIRAVRSLSAPQTAKLPAAAVTACAREDERQRALAAGFQLHLSKPLDPHALVRAVATLVQTASAGTA